MTLYPQCLGPTARCACFQRDDDVCGRCPTYCLRGREIVIIACGVSACFISLGKGRMGTSFSNPSSARMSGVVGCSPILWAGMG